MPSILTFALLSLETLSESGRKELRSRAEEYLGRAEHLKQLLKEQESK